MLVGASYCRGHLFDAQFLHKEDDDMLVSAP